MIPSIGDILLSLGVGALIVAFVLYGSRCPHAWERVHIVMEERWPDGFVAKRRRVVERCWLCRSERRG